ncbi:hypothetical protein [Aeromonas veronii]|uniref:hypothetical protein n=1 Tax=Aeromonas veronii TaxID=654 RepID=UPI000B5A1F1C|nr:hypothetical protein [Aeromonas veronii]
MNTQNTQTVELCSTTVEVRIFEGMYCLNDLHRAYCKLKGITNRKASPFDWYSWHVDTAGDEAIELAIIKAGNEKPMGTYTNLLGLAAYAYYLDKHSYVSGTDYEIVEFKLAPSYEYYQDYDKATEQLDHAVAMAGKSHSYKQEIMDGIYNLVGAGEIWDVIDEGNTALVAMMISWASFKVRSRKSAGYILKNLPNEIESFREFLEKYKA